MSESQPKIELGGILLCDDVREERTGKHILIGIYTGSIIVPTAPLVMRVHPWIMVSPKESGLASMAFEFRGPLAKPAKITGQAEIDHPLQITEYNCFALPPVILEISGPGMLEIYYRQYDQENWELVRSFPVQIEKSRT